MPRLSHTPSILQKPDARCVSYLIELNARRSIIAGAFLACAELIVMCFEFSVQDSSSQLVHLFVFLASLYLFIQAIYRNKISRQPRLCALALIIYLVFFGLYATLCPLLGFATSSCITVFLTMLIVSLCFFVSWPVRNAAPTLAMLIVFLILLNACNGINTTISLYLVLIWVCLTVMSFAGYREATIIAHTLQTLTKATLIDQLTGLANRRALREEFNSYIGKHICLFIADVDDLKSFNDTFGHAAGDEILTMFASCLACSFPHARIYRYGGDEFLVVDTFDDIDEIEKSVRLYFQRLASAQMDKTNLPLASSVGFAFGCPADKEQLQAIFTLADSNLYQAKNRGKSRAFGTAFCADKLAAKESERVIYADSHTLKTD